MNLEKYDQDFATQMNPPRDEPGYRVPEGDPLDGLCNGTHTLTLPDGGHRTFRVFNQKTGNLAGKRILAMLIGPDNTTDYENFAFVTPTGIQVWKRFQNQRQAKYAEALWKLADGEILEDYSVESSRRCFVCNRELTTPESMADGIGPTCKLKREGRVAKEKHKEQRPTA